MLITCPACQASYEIPSHLLVNTPVRMRCARCGAEWAWMGERASAEEHFELPDLFAAGPLPQASPGPPDDPLIRPDLPDRPELAIMPGLDVSGLDVPKLDTPGPEPAREPIGSPVYHPSSEPSLPLPAIEPPPRRDSMIEIPQMPVSMASPARLSPNLSPPNHAQSNFAPPNPGQDDADDHALGREAMFRRIIEANRQRGLAPQAGSKRPKLVAPKLIAIVALIVLIALFLGMHFVMVNGVTAGPAG